MSRSQRMQASTGSDMEQALFFGAMEKLLNASELTATDRLALMIYMFLMLAVVMTVWSYFLSPRRQKILLQDQKKMETLSRPWTLLALFHGDLYAASYRPSLSKEGRLLVLHKLAASTDMFTNTAAMASLAYVAELLVQRVPTILIQDIQLMLLWASSPAARVAQRIPLMMASLALNPANRDRLNRIPQSMKALVAGARAASKLRRFHSIIAVAISCKSRQLCEQLVNLGILDELAACIDIRKSTTMKDENVLLAAALALNQIARWESNRSLFRKLAFLRNIIHLTRSSDVRVQFAGVSIITSLARGGIATGSELRNAILDAGALVAIIPLVTCTHVGIQAQACRAMHFLLEGHGEGWKKRLRGLCASSDDAHVNQVLEVRRARVLSKMPTMLQNLDDLQRNNSLPRSVIENSLVVISSLLDGRFYELEEPSEPVQTSSKGEKVGDENEGEEEEEVEEEEEEEEYQDGESSPYASPRGSTSVTSEEGQDHSSDPANDGSSTKSMASTHKQEEQESQNVREAHYITSEHARVEQEDWGRELGSFTYSFVMEVFEFLRDVDVQEGIEEEIDTLFEIEIFLVLTEQMSMELPTLLLELRRFYSVTEENDSGLSEKDVAALQERGTSISRPVEATLTIIRSIKKESLELARLVSRGHKERARNGVPPWEFFSSFPMFSLEQMKPGGRHDEAKGAGAEKPQGGEEEFQMDDTLTVTKPLRAFLAEYHKNYVTERALVSQHQLLPRTGKRPEVMINKQFSRDVPNLLRINGHPCAGESPEDKVRFAYDTIVRAVDGNTEKAQRITLVANQNLGIFMYELLVKANSHRQDIVVMQVGEHHLDLKMMRRGIVIVFEALFRLQKSDSVELEGDVVKGFAKVDFVHKNVSFRFSKPKRSS